MLLRNVNIRTFDDRDFVVVNINNFSFFDFFVKRYTVFHSTSFTNFDVLLNLFSGNNYFVFINKYSYYSDLLDLLSFDDSDFELLAICYNNYFVNFSNKFFNMSNSFFVVIFVVIFFIFFYLNFFFSKLMVIYMKVNILENKK
jgi:hypothetical protein